MYPLARPPISFFIVDQDERRPGVIDVWVPRSDGQSMHLRVNASRQVHLISSLRNVEPRLVGVNAEIV
jgi:hypothetical protein